MAFPVESNTFLRSLRRWFFSGLLVAAPIFLTIYVIYLIIHTVDLWMQEILPDSFFFFPGAGLIYALVSITILGLLVSNVFGRYLIHYWDKLIKKMPVVSGVYSSIKQLFEAVLSDKSNTFKEVVLVQYPYPGAWSIGFVIGLAPAYATGLSEKVMTSVFLPTMPVPTAGFLLIVPDEELHRPDLTVEQGLKLVLSVGMVAPPGEVPEEAAPEHVPNIPAEFMAKLRLARASVLPGSVTPNVDSDLPR